MKKYCKNIDITDRDLISKATYKCLNGKYRRNDVLELFSSISGLTKNQIYYINMRFGKRTLFSIVELLIDIIRNELLNKEISKIDLRENYIITQSVVMRALGRVGNYFFNHPELNMEDSLRGLQDINWKRNADQWYLRTIKANGHMISNETAVILTSNVIKLTLGIDLDKDEQEREEKFKNTVQK